MVSNGVNLCFADDDRDEHAEEQAHRAAQRDARYKTMFQHKTPQN